MGLKFPAEDPLYEFDDLGIHVCDGPDDDDSEELWFDFLNPTDFTDGDY